MSKTKEVNHNISRAKILRKIKDHLEMIDQWSEKGVAFEWAYQNLVQAEALIELLEADDCGSHGGFDFPRGQTSPQGTIYEQVKARYKWLNSLSIGKP